jgi:hypothetical protein
MAQLLSVSFPFFTQQQIDQIVQIFSDRLTNELTREASLRALASLADNPSNKINLEGLGKMTDRMVDLLHKAEVQVHSSTLKTIYSLLQRYSEQFRPSASILQKELCAFINEHYIQTTSLAIQCASLLIQLDPKMP